MSLSKILYRDLLHAAKQFDRRASLRALLSSNLLQRPVIHESKTRLPHVENFNRFVLEYLENRSFYVPSAEKKTLAQLVREKFRAVDDDDAASVARSPAAAERVLVDTAFVALKALNDKLAEAKELGVIGDVAKKPRYAALRAGKRDEEQDTPLSIANVQHAEGPAQGVFLLSHPLLNGLFSRSVIMLTEHSHKGAKGFIVNQPTTSPLMKAFKVHPSIMRAFGSSKVRTGGPVRTEHAEVLHGKPEFGGQRIVTTNFHDSGDATLFVGVDLETAAKAVEENLAKQSEIMFLNGVSTWTAGQLENEMKRGTWVAVKAPLSLAVNPKKELWRDLMHTLGGEYKEFSEMPEIDDDEEDEDDGEDEEGVQVFEEGDDDDEED